MSVHQIVIDHEGSTNPKDVAGRAKCPMNLLPSVFLAGVANVLKVGGGKYGFWNWRDQPIQLSNYQAAALRHWAAIQSGEDIDPETGQSHWFHIGATCAIVEDARAHGTLIDDRPKGASRGQVPQNDQAATGEIPGSVSGPGETCSEAGSVAASLR